MLDVSCDDEDLLMPIDTMQSDEREENRTNMKIDTIAMNTPKGRSISFNSVSSEIIDPYFRTNEERSFEKRRWKE